LAKLNETKDTFFGIIAHDLRSPLTALNGSGSLMKHFLKQGKQIQVNTLADQIDLTTNRLSSLLDNLLNWALLQKGTIPYKPLKINVHSSINSILELFENNADLKQINIINQNDQKSQIFVDESSFNTIFRNLIHNAIKFSNDNGEIVVHSKQEENMTHISVEDNGIGMTLEQIESIYSDTQIQHRGTAAESGTGLGLTLIQQLVKLNKGTFKMKSELNKGSRVSIFLQAAK